METVWKFAIPATTVQPPAEVPGAAPSGFLRRLPVLSAPPASRHSARAAGSPPQRSSAAPSLCMSRRRGTHVLVHRSWSISH